RNLELTLPPPILPFVGMRRSCSSEAGAAVVKDCTTRPFCLMELRDTERSAAAFDRWFERALLGSCRPAGRMNARTADRAQARLHEMDRLETAGSRGESAYHHPCDQDPGPYAEGRRHRRDPDRTDGDTRGPYRDGRAVRGLRVLYPDLL